MDVAPNSPADLAGLLPYGDYVIGSPEVIVRGESGLGELIEDVSFDIFNPSLSFLSTISQSRRKDYSKRYIIIISETRLIQG
jgi:hypothetical protein